jgi:membrane-bound serine protease (ClpP class)
LFNSWRKIAMNSRHARRKSYVPAAIIVIVLVMIFLSLTGGTASAASPHVDVMNLNTQINPASLRFLTSAISTAETDGAQALVVEINTPGGDIQSMESMKVAELNSTVPIISYVSPTGAYAASAGAFIALAAHRAAMAPGTTIGASSPVTSTGGDIGSTEMKKIESVLVSDMTNIQMHYSRNVTDATKMVTDAASYTDQQAMDKGIIDLQASSLSDLLNRVNGQSVTLASGSTVTLQTAGAALQDINAGPVDTLYNLLLDPNVTFLLFIVAMIGIFVEISHPGAILPGVTGGIALLLFLFAAGSLAPNWAGLALMTLAFVLLVLDTRLPTHGALTVGAAISLIIGALLFFNSGGPYQEPPVNTLLVYAMGGLVGLVGIYVVSMIVRTRRRPVSTGTEGMIGATAIATTLLQPDGRVHYEGEDWAAVLDNPSASIDPGTEVRIVAVEGLLLHVKPVFDRLSDSTPSYMQGS